MNITAARKLFSSLPRGLTFTEVAARLCMDYQKARRLVHLVGYKASDGRKFSQNGKRRLQLSDLDPRLSTVQVAKKYGVSKQRISYMARQNGIKLRDTRGRRKSV